MLEAQQFGDVVEIISTLLQLEEPTELYSMSCFASCVTPFRLVAPQESSTEKNTVACIAPRHRRDG